MAKFIKLTAVVSVLAMLFTGLTVPSVAAETEVFSDKFEWVDYVTTTEDIGNLVYKAGTSIGGEEDSNHDDYDTTGYYMGSKNGPIATSIVDDPDATSGHGKVLKYSAEPNNQYDRGVFLNIPKDYHVSGYTSIEYDYKPVTGGDAAGVISTVSAEGTDFKWNGFNNYLGENGPVIQGAYYRNLGTMDQPDYKNKTAPKELKWTNYLPAQLLEDNGTLKKDMWHNIKYVYDPKTVTYDLYVDGYLIAAGCTRNSPDLSTENNVNKNTDYVIARILIGGRNGGGDARFEGYYDNFTVKKLTAKDMYAARKAGFEKKIGCAPGSTEGVIYADERVFVAT